MVPKNTAVVADAAAIAALLSEELWELRYLFGPLSVFSESGFCGGLKPLVLEGHGLAWAVAMMGLTAGP